MTRFWKTLRRIVELIVISILVVLMPVMSTVAYADADTESRAINGDHTFFQDVVDCSVGAKNPNAPAALSGLRDQIAQMLFVRADTKAVADDMIGNYHVGGIFVTNEFSGEMLDATNINNAKSKFSPAPFVGIDEEGGKVDRLGVLSESAKKMGGKSASEITSIAKTAADAMKQKGIDVDFAPVVDIDNPNSQAIGQLERSFSSDPNVIIEKAGAFAKGLHDGGVIPSYKHFPGIGNTTVNSDNAVGATPPLSKLKESDLVPYKTLLADGSAPGWVMMSNYSVPELTNGQAASVSKPAYDLLRKDYGFNGIAVTDDLAAGALGPIAKYVVNPDVAVNAIKAGADIALFGGSTQVKTIIDKLEADANADPALKSQIEASSSKITAAKASLANGPKPVNGGGGGCSCGGSATQLSGADNEHKAWNFLAGKGLSNIQVAGAMGNLKVESGGKFDPQQLEIQYSDPPHLWTKALELPAIRGPAGQPGLGIVQWTSPNRKQALLDKAKQSPAQSVIDMGVQLEFLWSELSGPYKSSVLDPLKQATDLATVVHLWQDHYEVGVAFEPRFAAAQHFLDTYGSGSPTAGGGENNSGGSQGGGCSNGGQQGPTGGTFSWPEKTEHSTIFQCFTGTGQGQHPGMDISNGPDGQPIFAAADGEVIKAGPADGYGPNFVVIKHASIKFGTSYGHMNKMSVAVGDQVKQGQQIGEQGNVGKSTGSHLHFNVFPGDYIGWDTANVNPLKNGLDLPAGVNNPNGCS